MKFRPAHLLATIFSLVFIAGCGTVTTFNPPPLPTLAPTGMATPELSVAETAVSKPLPTPQNITANDNPPPTITPLPTNTTTATAIPTQSPPPTLTPTPVSPCSERVPNDNLLTIVTQTYGLSRDYAPQDLVFLTDYLPYSITRGFPTELRLIAIDTLVQMMADMEHAGLQPRILSGYRSYAAQAISWEKWNREEPERAAILSARPGHSEHQLGTTVDFGSPELAAIVGIPNIQFHTYFYQTSEGIWLAENAHRYGFTLSYPRGALEITGFYYEPWHFRYVGEEMATFLHESGLYLTEYQLLNQPEPCIP